MSSKTASSSASSSASLPLPSSTTTGSTTSSGSGSGNRYVVALDGYSSGEAALSFALNELSTPNDELLLVHAKQDRDPYRYGAPPPSSELQRLDNFAQQTLSKALDKCSKSNRRCVGLSTSSGIGSADVGVSLIASAFQHQADAIVMGSRGGYYSPQRLLVGSVSKFVLNHAQPPTNVIIAKTPSP